MDYSRMKINEVLYTKQSYVLLEKPVRLVIERGTPVILKYINRKEDIYKFNIFGEHSTIILTEKELYDNIVDFAESAEGNN